MSQYTFKQCFIESFHPIWFASVMGTGISSVILYEFPYRAFWLQVMGLVLFLIASLLFIMHNIFLVLKYLVFYRSIEFIMDSKVSVFMGCYPMALCPLINMVLFIVKDYGSQDNEHWFLFMYILFWFDVIASLVCAWGITFVLFWKSQIKEWNSHGINATLLLPIVTLTVALTTGFVIFDYIPEHMRLFHLILCFVIWSNAIMLLFPFVSIYFAKLYITKLPAKPMIFTTFIPIGFLGQGAFGLFLFGDCAKSYIESADIASSDVLVLIVQVVSVIMGLMILSFGYFMTFIACASVISAGQQQKFTKNWWLMTFPLGTMAVGNSKLGVLYDLEVFKVVGGIYGIATVLITVTCLLGSLYEEFPHQWYQQKFFADKETSRTASCNDINDLAQGIASDDSTLASQV